MGIKTNYPFSLATFCRVCMFFRWLPTQCSTFIADDVLFESKLNDKSKAKAKRELGENEKDRLGAVQSFRSLVQQQNLIRTPTGTMYLQVI